MAEEMLPQRGTIEAKDPFSMAPPGYGLTSDNERWPWGKPQEDVDPEVVLRKAVDSLEVPHVREEMMKLLVVGASVEALVEGYLFQAFQEGGFSPDVGLLIKGPLAMYIASVAEERKHTLSFVRKRRRLDRRRDGRQDVLHYDARQQPGYVLRTSVKRSTRVFVVDSMPQPPREENFMTMTKKES